MSKEGKLFKYSFFGKKEKLKKLIRIEGTKLNLDVLNEEGFTALFVACEQNNKSCAKVLLENGANPNIRCVNGETALHITAYNCNIKIMTVLLEYDGDLRLHDNNHQLPYFWIKYQKNSKLRNKMIDFLEQVKHEAIQNNTSNFLNRPEAEEKRGSIFKNMALGLRKATNSILHLNSSKYYLDDNSEINERLQKRGSFGRGTLYRTPSQIGLAWIVLPIIDEIDLAYDNTGRILKNGAFTTCRNMIWKESHRVTVKKLNWEIKNTKYSDLLIDELKILREINNFPKILNVIGFFHTDKASNVAIVFERINIGSLFNIIHEKCAKMNFNQYSITTYMLDIADALIYLHQKNIIHCFVSSHSVFLTTSRIAKLGNFEYAIEKNSNMKTSQILEVKKLNCSWNWLAPELILDKAPNEASDMYGFCVVLWELFYGRIPWENFTHIEIKEEVVDRESTLPLDFDSIPLPFSRIILDGFSFEAYSRMNFSEVRSHLEYHKAQIRKITLEAHREQKRLSKIRSSSTSFFPENLSQQRVRTKSQLLAKSASNLNQNSDEVEIMNKKFFITMGMPPQARDNFNFSKRLENQSNESEEVEIRNTNAYITMRSPNDFRQSFTNQKQDYSKYTKLKDANNFSMPINSNSKQTIHKGEYGLANEKQAIQQTYKSEEERKNEKENKNVLSKSPRFINSEQPQTSQSKQVFELPPNLQPKSEWQLNQTQMKSQVDHQLSNEKSISQPELQKTRRVSQWKLQPSNLSPWQQKNLLNDEFLRKFSLAKSIANLSDSEL